MCIDIFSLNRSGLSTAFRMSLAKRVIFFKTEIGCDARYGAQPGVPASELTPASATNTQARGATRSVARSQPGVTFL